MVNFTPPSELSKIQTTFSDDSLIVISVYNSNTGKYESTCSVKYSDFIKHFVHAENGDSNDDHLKLTRSITISSIDNDKNKIKITLKDKDGNTIAETNEYSFGVGSVVKSAKYENKHLTIEFDEGIDPIDIDMEELVSDLQHKLDAVNGITISNDYKIGHSNSEITAQTQSKIYKIKHDNFGHIIESTAVTKSDITDLGIPGQDTTYTTPSSSGLTIEDTQIKHSSTIQAQQNPVFKKIAYNGTGHITAISDVTYNDMPSDLKSKITTLENNKVDKSTTVNSKNLGSNIILDGGDIELTGYTKPQETATITSTDTINEAIGKLEKGSYWVKKTIDLTVGWDQDYWFPVTGTPLVNGANNHILVDVQLNSGSHPNWSTHDSGYTVILDMIVTAAGWGTTYGNSICLQHSARFVENEQEPPVSYWQLTKSSTPVLWCRGGGKYFVWTNYECNWTPHNYPGITIQEETVVPTTIYPNLDFAKSTIIANIQSDSIELTGSKYPGIATNGGTIDFHFAESTDDYTTRIAEYERGVLAIGAKNTSGVEVGGVIRTLKDPSNDNDLTRKQYVDRGTTYYHCETAANNPSKVIETTDGSWYDESEWANQLNNKGEKIIYKPGRRITIQFSGQNTAENPTLNVHNHGAKPIYYRNAPISGHDLSLLVGVCEFVYDGAEWLLVGNNHKQVIPANSYQDLYTITYDSEGHITSTGQPQRIELIGNDTVGDTHGGYIDFHFAESINDYTSRIIEDEHGVLTVAAKNSSGVEVGGVIRTLKDPSNDNDLTRKGYVDSSISAVIINIIGSIYPVGSIYLDASNSNACPIAALIAGSTWIKIEGRYILGSGQLGWGWSSETYTVGQDVPPGLPQHNHSIVYDYYNFMGGGGHGTEVNSIGTGSHSATTANASDPIYGASGSVRPPAFVVNIWKRTS